MSEIDVMPEAVELEDTQGVEEVEVAEPSDDNMENDNVEEVEKDEEQSKQDSAFASMRRELEEANREIEKLSQFKSDYMREKTDNDLELQAMEMAERFGLDVEDVLEGLKEEQESQNSMNSLQAERDELMEKLSVLERDREIENDLSTLKRLDPSIKTFEDIPQEFFDYRFHESGGYKLSAEDSYHMMKLKQEKTTRKPPEQIGKVNKGKVESDFYTSEELDQLTQEEVSANREKVDRSLEKFYKGEL